MEWQQPCDHFFRIIMDSTMATKKLILPRLFVESRLDELSETVKLKAPNSQAWTVGLTVKNRRRRRRRSKTPEAWLDAGFSEFLESLSISHGHFLVFEYQGMSKFKVAVYDKTTCEISYPPSSNGSPMADRDDDDDSDDGDSGVIYMGSSFYPPTPDLSMGRRNGPSSSSSQPRPRETAAETRVSEAADGVVNHHALLREMQEANIQTGLLPSTILRMSARSKEAVQRAIASPPANPSAMAVLLSAPPYLPGEFSRAHLGRADMNREGRWMYLEVAGVGGGRQWEVMIRPQCTGVIFGKEWANFCSDNDLVEGDVWLFEVIGSEKLRVHIFHAANE